MSDPPRKINMGDMLRSNRPNPAFHDAQDEHMKQQQERQKEKEERYANLSDTQREVLEYRDAHNCTMSHAVAVIRHRYTEEKLLRQYGELNEQLSNARKVEDLKPILQAIIDKLWSQQ